MTMLNVSPSAAQTQNLPAKLSVRPDMAQKWLTHSREPISWEEACKRVLAAAQHDGARGDKVVDLRAYGFGSVNGRDMQIMQTIGGRTAPVSLRARAFSQLAKRLGVPGDYIRNLPSKYQIALVNLAFANLEGEGTAFLRMAGDEIRAVVSDSYAPVDDAHLMEMVDNALAKSGFRNDAMVRSVAVGAHTIIRVTVPNEAVAVKVNDTIEWGIDIGNSELGLRSIQITPVTYRLICTNGMRNWHNSDVVRMRHTGDTDRLHARVNAVLPTAFAEARGDIERWRKSVDTMIDDASDDINMLRGFGMAVGDVRAIGRTLTGLPESTSSKELDEALSGFRTTAFDFANAITQTARDRTDVESRLSLEETGHRYLTRRAS